MKAKKTVSDAVRQKNQRISKKSTGPTSAQGKNNSRFNAVKHGLTSRLLMYDQDGEPIEGGVMEMIEALRDRYGADNIVAELLIDNIAADFWRQNKGFEAELSYVSQGKWPFFPHDSLPTLQRYNTSNRRALLRNLELLEELCPASEASQLSAVADNDEHNSTPVDEEDTFTPTQEPSSIDQAPPPEVETGGLDVEHAPVAHSEEQPEQQEPPMLGADPDEGDAAV